MTKLLFMLFVHYWWTLVILSCFIIVIYFLSKLKLAENALKQSEEKYRSYLDSAPDGIFIVDNTGRYVEVNKSACRITGYSKDELLNMSIKDLVAEESVGAGLELFNKLHETSSAISDIWHRRKDGSKVYLTIEAVKLSGTRFLGFCKDITGHKRAEESVQVSEAKYRALVETTKTGYLILDTQGRVVDANQEYVRLSGHRELHEILGKSVVKWTAEYEKEKNAKAVAQCAREGFIRDFVIDYVDNAGRITPVEINATVVKDGEKFRILSLCRDVTERKQAENILSDLIEYNPMSIQIVDKNGFTLKVNHAHTMLFGSVPPPDFSIFDDIQKKSKELKILILRAKSGEIVHFPDIYYNIHDINTAFPDVPVWIRAICFPLMNSKNIPERFVLMHENITSQKKYEDALVESEKKYRELIENINDAVFTTDAAGKITYISPISISFTGYTPEEIAGRPLRDFIDPEDLPGLDKNFKHVMENRLGPLEFRVRAKNGQTKWVRTSSRPIMLSGSVVGVQGVMCDISERKKIEDELYKARKLDSLGVLAGGIAHDFNNILTGIIGNISMARHQCVDSSGKDSEILNEAEKASFRAKNLANQLLVFAKGSAPKKQLTVLSDLIKDSVKFSTHGSKTKYSFNIAPDIRLVNVDPGQITQVISNITINAVQAMPEGGDLKITADNVSLPEQQPSIPLKPGLYVRIIMNDTGAGIPAKYLEKIFDPYFTTKATGNGLGLATSYSIIKNHNGHITVESEVGKGAVFTFYLPAFTDKPEELGHIHGAVIKKGSGRVLVLDDEQSVCKVIADILIQLGYTVECFADSDQAAERYRKAWNTPDAFDAVILDLTVPGGKGGKVAIGALLGINPAIKAVVSSGYSSDPIMANYKDYGFSAVLPKPYTVEEVSEVLYILLMKDKPS